MSRLMARQGDNPNQLLFLRKPLKIERHKGGPAMAEDDPGYRCVVAWLQIPVVDGNGTSDPEGAAHEALPERSATARPRRLARKRTSFGRGARGVERRVSCAASQVP